MLLVLTTLRAQRVFANARNSGGAQRFAYKSASTSSSPPGSEEAAHEVFIAPASKPLQILCYVGAATQFIFWRNLAEWAGMGYAVKDEYDPLPDCANAPLKLVNMSGLTHQAGNLRSMACRHGSSICICISLDPLKVETSWHRN